MSDRPGQNDPAERDSEPALSTIEEPTIVLPGAPALRDEEHAGQAAAPTKRRRAPRGVWALGMAAALLVAGVLVAIWLAGRSNEPAAPTPISREVAAPIALQADPHDFRVVLRWIQPSTSPVSGYRIYRDGSFLTRMDPATTFTDDDALPAKRYEYEVEALSGSAQSERATITVRTTRAPLSAARLEGVFDVRARVVSSSGYSNSIDRQGFGWSFAPRCDEGACSVVWRDLHLRKVKAKLVQHGARYTGTFHGPFNVRCGGTDTDSDVTLDLRVERARVTSDAWRVVKLVGTLKHTEPSQLGCVTSSATFSITARLAD